MHRKFVFINTDHYFSCNCLYFLDISSNTYQQTRNLAEYDSLGNYLRIRHICLQLLQSIIDKIRTRRKCLCFNNYKTLVITNSYLLCMGQHEIYSCIRVYYFKILILILYHMQ